MAVVGELLHRKCNVAIPHVDIGTDVFAFRDDSEDVARIQVKTARGRPYRKGNGYRAEFAVPLKQLERADGLPLFYAFAVRLTSGWGRFIVISRVKLHELRERGCGSANDESGVLKLYLQFHSDEGEEQGGLAESGREQRLKAACGKFDLSDCINAWESLPPLKPPVPIDVDAQGKERSAARDGANEIESSEVEREDSDLEPPQT